MGFNPDHQIALIWSIADVQAEPVRPDLNNEQAMDVLRYVERKHDPIIGVTWDTIKITADMLFPRN